MIDLNTLPDGETILATPVPTSLDTRIQRAVGLAWCFNEIEGAHHRQWLIDQMVRNLLGEQYESFVKEYEEPIKNDEKIEHYKWNKGIPP